MSSRRRTTRSRRSCAIGSPHLRPGDTVLGEEHGGSAVGPGVHWVVDPIDGTVNFLYGLPWYAVSVAAVRDGRSLAGAVVEPASGRVWSAGLGAGGDLRRGAPLRSPAPRTSRSRCCPPASPTARERRARQVAMIAGLLPHVRDVRRTGSAALDLCGVAAGWVDAYLEHGCSWWDWAAAALVATEAGAVVRTPGAGGRVPPEDGLGADALYAATPAIADELCALAAEHGAGAGERWCRSGVTLLHAASAAGRLAGRGERGRVDDRCRGGRARCPRRGRRCRSRSVPEPDAPSWSSASRTARPGFTSLNAVPTATSTVSSARPSRTSSAHGTSSATVLAAPWPGLPEAQLPGAHHVAVGVERVVGRRGRLREVEVAELRGHEVRLSALAARVEHAHLDRRRRHRRHVAPAPPRPAPHPGRARRPAAGRPPPRWPRRS